ncbi:PsbP-related protein [Patescibacteria group bacterium]
MPKKYSQSGVSHILMIVAVVVVIGIIIAFVSGAAKFNFSASKDDGSGSSAMDKGKKEKMKTYTSETYGFSIEYPSTWTVKEGASEETVVSFLSQRVGPEDQFTENVGVSVSDISQLTGFTASDLIDLWLQQNESDPLFDSFLVGERGNLLISGFDAAKADYTASVKGINLKGRVVITQKDNMAFIFAFMAEESAFDDYIGEVETIIASTSL